MGRCCLVQIIHKGRQSPFGYLNQMQSLLLWPGLTFCCSISAYFALTKNSNHPDISQSNQFYMAVVTGGRCIASYSIPALKNVDMYL